MTSLTFGFFNHRQCWQSCLIIVFGVVMMPIAVQAGEVVVIFHKGSNLTRSDISRIYRCELSGYKPYDLRDESWQEEFSKAYLGMKAADLKYIQDQALYAGRSLPPRKLENTQEMLDIVSQTPNAVGYVPSDAVTDAVEVLR